MCVCEGEGGRGCYQIKTNAQSNFIVCHIPPIHIHMHIDIHIQILCQVMCTHILNLNELIGSNCIKNGNVNRAKNTFNIGLTFI